MKLAEALAERADAQRRLAQVKSRIAESARHQEGTDPSEDAGELLAEAERTLVELESLMARINRTNLGTELEPGRTLTDALASRDVLAMRRKLFADTADAAVVRHDRWLRTEIRFVPAVDVRALRAQADDAARAHRQLDTRIQELNWSTELTG